MTRSVSLLGLTLVLAGASIFGWKVVGHGMPLLPSEADNIWRVELQVDLLALAQRGSVSTRLPHSTTTQEIYDERIESAGLEFALRETGAERLGVWRGEVSGTRRVAYSFRVRLTPSQRSGDPVPESIGQGYLGPVAGVPVGAPEIDDLLERLRIDEDDDEAVVVRRLFAFVTEEIDAVPFGSRDALITLVAREGSSAGQASLLATLLRRSGVPARLATGLVLSAPREERELTYVEAVFDGRWTPFFPSLGTMGTVPKNMVAMGVGEASLVEASGYDTIQHRYRVVREQLRPEELKAVMLPPNRLLGLLSLYRLPIGTQQVLRVLLVLPLAALLVAALRNLIGLQTFGTFLPILIPLSLRETSLALGLTMLFSVLGVGVLGRLFLERFRLLFVPRMCVLLCLVILLIVGFSLLGHSLGNRDILTGVLFPIVILTMLIERFSITAAEEGLREAFSKFLTTMLVVLTAYPLFHAETVSQLMFGFPELVFAVMGLLVWMGGYRGYRLSEVLRFRALAALARRVEA